MFSVTIFATEVWHGDERAFRGDSFHTLEAAASWAATALVDPNYNDKNVQSRRATIAGDGIYLVMSSL